MWPSAEAADGSHLVVRGLTKSFGSRTVVSNVSLEVRSGEIVALIGPNGAGKTSVLRMIAGMLSTDAGTVTLAQRGHSADVSKNSAHARSASGLSYLAQESTVFRMLSVADNIRVVWEMQRVPKAQREQQVGPYLKRFGLEHLAGARAASLSGGERRRVEIARALAGRASLLLLDEPFSGIDPIGVGEIQSVIVELAGQGIGVLMTDHRAREVLSVANRAYAVLDGRVIVAGTSAEVSASEVVRRRYLGPSSIC